MRIWTVLKVTRYGAILAAVLTIIAMFLYPGGTVLNPNTSGYSFFQNSLSDLGATVAWNGHVNPSSRIHLAASVMLVLAGVGCFGSLVRLYSGSPITTWLAGTAGAVAALAGVGLIGAGLAPYDRDAALHRWFSLLAVMAFPVATSLLFVATVVNDSLRRRISVGWFALTGVVVLWASMMLRPQPTTELELAIPVTLQKLAAAALVATIVFQSREAAHARVLDASERTASNR
jgi:hypothetical membrane protein